ncbi:hypothetical protein ACHHYP_06360 [Achlya hypogyna]|uniref:WRKY19-like zinc finger domain-containing protein n=1 Tax=Achlya hypogyna TaxID=1202772 RepID=A0A1V9YUD9_ACHHY|nr:hypothetical protein ACHHYP_06360 [Achlya hypogyna]
MSISAVHCCFNGCINIALDAVSRKCNFHRNRSKCAVGTCWNQVYARGLCVGHGGRKPCEFPLCLGKARSGQFCSRHSVHSPIKHLCDVSGCGRRAHAKAKCLRHGGARMCSVHGCETLARKRGYCWSHGKQLLRPIVDIVLQDFIVDVPAFLDVPAPMCFTECAEALLDASILDKLIQDEPIVSIA